MGQVLPVNLSINVTAGTGTPSGDVSLIAQTGATSSNQTGIGPFSLSAGSFSGSTIMLPGGSYSIIAHYPGDGHFAASDSSPAISVHVNQEGSQTLLSLVTPDPITGTPVYGATSAVYGSVYVLRMDVTNSSGNRCSSLQNETISYPCPTGALTVSPAPTDLNPPTGTIPGHYTLNTQGYAEDQPIQLSPSVYSFIGAYAGDSSYNSSVSNPLQVTITAGQTSTSMSGVPTSTIVSGTSVTVTGVISTTSNGAAPSGTLQLLNNGTPLGNPVIVFGTASTSSAAATAQATIIATPPVGSDSLSVQYSGDVNYATSTSTTTKVSVTDFSVAANPSPINISAPGQTGNSTITITPLAGFTGSVSLTVAGGCPTGATCTFSPASVNITSATAATSTLTVTTTAPAAAPLSMPKKFPPNSRFPVGILRVAGELLVLSLVLVAISSRRWRPAFMIAASTFLIASLWIACGGSGGGGGTIGPPAPSPVISLSVPSLTFASQNTGTTSAAQAATLSNTGNAVLIISSLSLSGANMGDFNQTNTCGSSVATNSNCSISVTFTPSAAGTRTAAVTIIDNASGSPHSIGLTGTGIAQPTPTGTSPLAVHAASGVDNHSITVNVVVQ